MEVVQGDFGSDFDPTYAQAFAMIYVITGGTSEKQFGQKKMLI